LHLAIKSLLDALLHIAAISAEQQQIGGQPTQTLQSKGQMDTQPDCRRTAALETGIIRLLPGPHLGVSATRNRAVAAARGTWFAYLDSDNAWHGDHLLLLLYSALAHPSAPDLLYSGRALYGPRVSGLHLPVPSFERNKLELGNFIDLNCLLHHRRLYDQHGGFDTTLRRLVDWDLLLHYTAPTASAVVQSVNVCTVDYWRHPQILHNISTSEDWALARDQVRALHRI
jgi:glycosyltransferase involved in cell wall biosynthesis